MAHKLFDKEVEYEVITWWEDGVIPVNSSSLGFF